MNRNFKYRGAYLPLKNTQVELLLCGHYTTESLELCQKSKKCILQDLETK